MAEFPTDSEMLPSANDVAPERIQQKEREENHDCCLSTPPIGAPSSVSPSNNEPLAEIHTHRSLLDSTDSSSVESNTSQAKSDVVRVGLISNQLHEFDSVFQRAAASIDIHLDNQPGQLSNPAVCDIPTLGPISSSSEFTDGYESFPIRIHPNSDDGPSSATGTSDLIDGGPMKEESSSENSTPMVNHVTEPILPASKDLDDQKEEMTSPNDASNMVIIKEEFIDRSSSERNRDCKSRNSSQAGVPESNATEQQQNNKSELTVLEFLSIETSTEPVKSVQVDIDFMYDHVNSTVAAVDLPNTMVSQAQQQLTSLIEEKLPLSTLQEPHQQVSTDVIFVRFCQKLMSLYYWKKVSEIVGNGDKGICSVLSSNVPINSSDNVDLNLNTQVSELKGEVLASLVR